MIINGLTYMGLKAITILKNLKLDEVDWNNKTIIVTGKGSKQREVFFQDK